MGNPAVRFRTSFLAPFISLSCFLIFSSTISASTSIQTSKTEYNPNEILVKYKEGVRRNKSAMESLYSLADVVKVKRFNSKGVGHNVEQLFLSGEVQLEKAIEELRKNPNVEYAHPNYIVHALPIAESTVAAATLDPNNVTMLGSRKDWTGVPCVPGWDMPGCEPIPCLMPGFPPGCGGGPKDPIKPVPKPINPGGPPIAEKPKDVDPSIADPNIKDAYGMTKIGADLAWAQNIRGSSEMVVAVIDTGVDYNHEDLSFNIWRNPTPDEKKKDLVGWDFVSDDALPFDDNSHGTHCSGVIGATGGNGVGISGVNQRVSIMGVKFLDKNGSGNLANSIRAIDYAVERGAKVLSNSWGASVKDDGNVMRDAILRAEKKGVLFIAAAGNNGADNDTTDNLPSNIATDNMIAVAATDESDLLASFSNYGLKSVHIGAPGVNVYSSIPGGKYKKYSGTSMACPHVAGAAALIWSANPTFTYKEVKQKLLDTADPVPALIGKSTTGGRLNVARALNLIK